MIHFYAVIEGGSRYHPNASSIGIGRRRQGRLYWKENYIGGSGGIVQKKEQYNHMCLGSLWESMQQELKVEQKMAAQRQGIPLHIGSLAKFWGYSSLRAEDAMNKLGVLKAEASRYDV